MSSIHLSLRADQAERIFKLLDKSTLTWLSRMRIMRPEARLQRMFALMEDQELMMYLENEIDRDRTERGLSSLASLASEIADERAMEARDRRVMRKPLKVKVSTKR